MRWTGIIVFLFLVFHLMDLTWGTANSEFVRGDPYNNLVYSLQRPVVAIVYIVANIALGVPPVPRRLVDVSEPGHQQPAHQQGAPRVRDRLRGLILVGNLGFPIAVQTARGRPRVPAHRTVTDVRTVRGELTMTLDSKIPDRSARREVGQPQVRHQARQPREQAAVRHHRRRYRARRRARGREPGRARLQREGHHVPRLAAARALDRRAGRDQRRQELQERRRQHLAALLRHDQGRRLPRPRSQRLPARAGVGRHHRPVRRAGRAVRT